MSRNFLSINEGLRKGDSLVSNNGEFKAVFQNDQNFVVYGWKPVWASNTWKSGGTRLVMQADCNLVMYDDANVPKWSSGSNTAECAECSVRLSDEGKLVVYRQGEPIWTAE